MAKEPCLGWCAMRLAVALTLILAFATICSAKQQFIVISKDGRGFSLAESSQPFVPWGFNYPAGDVLLEDIWEKDWERVVQDFREMRDLGANVIRVHLQIAKFLDGP